MAKSLAFHQILGLKSDHGLLRRIERRLSNIPEKAESFVENLSLLSKDFDELTQKHFKLFTQSSLECRQKLISIVDEKINQMKTIMDETITDDDWTVYSTENDGSTKSSEWSEFELKLELFRWFCSFKFDYYNESPLKFAQNSVKTLDYTKNLETELIKIIEQFNKQLEKPDQHIFVKECEKMRNRRNLIVITCLGSLKAGKSSFINFLLGKEICPTGNEETTARLTKIQYGSIWKVDFKRHDAVEPESFEFTNEQDLHNKVVELVKLKNTNERTEGCRDEVIVQLPIDELKDVELWDIPGFDENEEIDDRIEDILAQTDIIFALMPLRDNVRNTFQNYVRLGLTKNRNIDKNLQRGKSCESLVCFVVTCIDLFCVDQQTQRTRDQVLQQLFEKLAETFTMKLSAHTNDSYTDSNRFLPMCTKVGFNVRDHQECRKRFIEKSSTWYQAVLADLIKLRLDWMQCIIQQILDFEDAKRAIKSCNRLKKRIQSQMQIIGADLQMLVQEKLELTKSSVRDILLNVEMKMIDYLDNENEIKNTHIDFVNKTIISALEEAYKPFLNTMQVTITRAVVQAIAKLSMSVDIGPNTRQLLANTLCETSEVDPYQFQNGIYTAVKKFTGAEFWNEILLRVGIPFTINMAGGALFSGIFLVIGGAAVVPLMMVMSAGLSVVEAGTMSLLYCGDKLFNYAKDKYRQQKIRNDVAAAVRKMVENYHNKIMQKVLNDLSAALHDIKKRLKETIEEKQQTLENIEQVLVVAKILETQLLDLKRLYLEIIEREFNFEHGPKFQINWSKLRGKSNFKVYEGQLGDIPVAVKCVPFNQFNLQEIRYMKQLTHPNIVQYYGVQKLPDSSYAIIMELYDYNLLEYLNCQAYHKRPFEVRAIDDMLKAINRGLRFIHKDKIVHRDIKPSNILVKGKTAINNEVLYAIADFGLARIEPLSLVGTPTYVAPEVIDSKLGPTTDKSDVYSFGITIKEIIKRMPAEIQHNPQIKKWKKIAEKCVLNKSEDRPTCSDIEDKLLAED